MPLLETHCCCCVAVAAAVVVIVVIVVVLVVALLNMRTCKGSKTVKQLLLLLHCMV